jgi:Ca2+-transporting ATPase
VPNELKEGATRSPLEILWDQFKNIMLLMLIAVALVSLVLDLQQGAFPKDAIAIFAIVLLNGMLGYLQESKAEKALAALKNMTSPRVRVIRDGQEQEVDAKALVPGDIILLEAGVQVPADGRLLNAANLQIREAALTGEAEAVTKQTDRTLPEDAPLGDRINLVFQGTEVLQGRGTVLVTRTGMETELGRIATMIQSVEVGAHPPAAAHGAVGQCAGDRLPGAGGPGGSGRTGAHRGPQPVRRTAGSFPQYGGGGGAGGTACRHHRYPGPGHPAHGAPPCPDSQTACGGNPRLRHHHLFRQNRHPDPEQNGGAAGAHPGRSVPGDRGRVCPRGEILANDQPVSSYNIPALQNLLMGNALCNDAKLTQAGTTWSILGDPTEGALLALAGKGGFDPNQASGQGDRMAEIPFTSERKRMSVVVSPSRQPPGPCLGDSSCSPKAPPNWCWSAAARDSGETSRFP